MMWFVLAATFVGTGIIVAIWAVVSLAETLLCSDRPCDWWDDLCDW